VVLPTVSSRCLFYTYNPNYSMSSVQIYYSENRFLREQKRRLASTTLIDAPISVAPPPTSVPKAKARAKVGRFSLVTCENSPMMGFMVAAKGGLPVMTRAKPDVHRIRGRSNFLERHSIHANSKRTAVRS
jgi:hypothetical protein